MTLSVIILIHNEVADIFPACVGTGTACVETGIACVGTGTACVETGTACVGTGTACVETGIACVGTGALARPSGAQLRRPSSEVPRRLA